MNTEVLKSKKFRAAITAALASLLTFAVGKSWLELDVEETMTMVATVATPFLIYIGAEGYSERDAKALREKAIKENNAD